VVGGVVAAVVAAVVDPPAGDAGATGKEIEVGTPRMLNLFERNGIKATWFIPGHSIETFPSQVELMFAAAKDWQEFLCLAVLGTGLSTMALSLTHSLVVFYLLFCFARMVWAGPFDLGLYGALNSWFVTRRALATSIATLAQMSGLVAMPLIAQLAMRDGGWRSGWVAGEGARKRRRGD